MNSSWFYFISFEISTVIFLGLLFGCVEISYRIGGLQRRRIGRDIDQDRRGDVILTAMLALLGLVLAFTYSFTVSRSDMRKIAMLEEVNALGTAFARADLLEEPHRSDIRKHLSEYARMLHVTRAEVDTAELIQQMLVRFSAKQTVIWSATRKAFEDSAAGPLEVSFVASINTLFDANTTRATKAFDQLPTALLFFILSIAGISLSVAGYSAGLTDSLRRWRMSALTFVLAALVILITDFDRPFGGFVRISQENYVRLADEMEEALEK